MKINIHAGHNPDGKTGCGAVGIMGESTMNRQVVTRLVALLQKSGHTVYDCTVDSGTSARDVLEKIVKKCNSHTVDLDISIHHNAFSPDSGDGRVKGCEVYVYRDDSPAIQYAYKVRTNLKALGFPDRGMFIRKDLYVLHHTNAPAMLVECCFCDDADDMNIWNSDRVALAIASAIDPTITFFTGGIPQMEGPWYKVQIGAFKDKKNAQALLDEVKNAGYEAFIQEIK